MGASVDVIAAKRDARITKQKNYLDTHLGVSVSKRNKKRARPSKEEREKTLFFPAILDPTPLSRDTD